MKTSIEDLEDSAIYKYMHGECMTLEETAAALAMYDRAHGKPDAKPMTPMGILKMEKRILEKLKPILLAHGINKETLQMFGNCKRTCATGTYANNIDGN